MGTITSRTKADGTVSYTAQIRIRRAGNLVHSEAQTFDRKPAAAAWLKKREKDLKLPGAIDRAKTSGITLAHAIDRYLEESTREVKRTKAQVLRFIRSSPLGAMACDTIASHHIVEFAQELAVQPQTAGNYLSHLGAVFAIARPAWGYPLDQGAMADATTVARRLGIVNRSRQRDRRPSLQELDLLLHHFADRRVRTPQAMPMASVIAFALFSTRRQEEIIRILWDDLDREHSRILVRDMKNPGETAGNNVWVDIPEPALRIISSMPRKKDEIFPFTTDAVSANFTRACKLLGIEDLHFHDLRHEGISRLFEMGLTIPHVAAVSGHRSWISLKRYTHIRQTGDRYKDWPWLDRLAPPAKDQPE